MNSTFQKLQMLTDAIFRLFERHVRGLLLACTVNRTMSLRLIPLDDLFVCSPQDVFTISVGNLPPGATVLIKVTFVSELIVEDGSILFSLPGSVAPWQESAALNQTTQVRKCDNKSCLRVSLCVCVWFNRNNTAGPSSSVLNQQLFLFLLPVCILLRPV